ncbi:MAG: hypothetical protein KGY70_18725, partial [Bacteroidales bacterium]|nr:hypothetical protein [Bacteroidales bacterium]
FSGFFQKMINELKDKNAFSNVLNFKERVEELQKVQTIIGKEIDLLEKGEYVKPGGRIIPYRFLGIGAVVVKKRLEEREKEKMAAYTFILMMRFFHSMVGKEQSTFCKPEQSCQKITVR